MLRERDTAVPVHRWQGLLAEPAADSNPTGADEGEGASGEGGAAASLTGGERVLGVALAASAVRTALWRALGGWRPQSLCGRPIPIAWV